MTRTVASIIGDLLKEERALSIRLGKVQAALSAIEALAVVPASPKKARKATPRQRKPMTSAQRLAHVRAAAQRMETEHEAIVKNLSTTVKEQTP